MKEALQGSLHETFIFREIFPEEAEQAAEIESICFPPNEACPPEQMKRRVEAVPELFLVAVDARTGRIAGFLNGLSTDEKTFRDEFFTDSSLHKRDGKHVMLCGLDVLPAYRRIGLARELVRLYAARERARGRERLVLTCLDDKTGMYEAFGFRDLGMSASVWGGEAWHEMELVLAPEKGARLQIAADLLAGEALLQLAGQVQGAVDIFEVGTPAIMREGMAPVRRLRTLYPELTILADSKIMDGGALEAEDICRAGADILTVLAVSDNTTVREVVETAHRFGKRVMADLMCIEDIPGRSKELIRLGVDYVCVHTGTDMQKLGRTPLKDLARLVQAIDPAKAAVAGGIRLETLDEYTCLKPGIIIAGNSLTSAPDVRAAALAMKKVLTGGCCGSGT